MIVVSTRDRLLPRSGAEVGEGGMRALVRRPVHAFGNELLFQDTRPTRAPALPRA